MRAMRGRPIPGMQEFSQRLGDVPGDLGSATRAPSQSVPGFDTTGTRHSDPGAAQYGNAAAQFIVHPALNPFYQTILQAFKALYRQAHFNSGGFTVGNVSPLQLRPMEDRCYLLIQNTSAATIYLGIGFQPTAATGVQLPAGAVYEPFQLPDNEIYVLGSAAGQTGVILWANP